MGCARSVTVRELRTITNITQEVGEVLLKSKKREGTGKQNKCKVMFIF